MQQALKRLEQRHHPELLRDAPRKSDVIFHVVSMCTLYYIVLVKIGFLVGILCEMRKKR